MLALGAFFLATASSINAQIPSQSNAAFWNNPEFVQKFIGSYGFHSELEPKISIEEQKLFQGLAAQIQADPAVAAASLQSALKPDSSAALDFTLGNLLFQTGSLDAAARAYEKAIEKFPDFQRAHKNIGFLRVQQGQFEKAVASLTRALELKGGDGNVFGLIGYCHLNLGKHLSAESAYRNALLFAPENNDWKLGLARALLEQEKHRDAAALFEELIRAEPEKADYWLFQANARIALNEPMKAAANFEMVRRMGKATAASMTALGDIYLNHDLPELALNAYRSALDQTPAPPADRLLNAAEIFAQRGQWTEAASLIARIKESQAGKALAGEDELHLRRLEAMLALSNGEAQKAVQMLEQVVARDPLDGKALLLLADQLGREGQFEKAELLYDRAAKLKGFEAEALAQHAQLLVQQGKFTKAVELLQRAQQIEPRDHVARYLAQVERLARAAR